MSFQLINSNHQDILANLVSDIPELDSSDIADSLAGLIDRVHQDIPDKRRISTGRYSIVKALGEELYPLLQENGVPTLDFAARIFEHPAYVSFVRALALSTLANHALESEYLAAIQPYFIAAAGAEDWILRECASGLVRPLIKTFPEQVRDWYLKLVKSEDPNTRRFVSESLRPVVENRWFHKQPDYALGVIQYLFQEKETYPRSSVGNNLSDWMRVDEVYTWPIVSDLAHNGDPNSYWIAYRACRNYVKKQPLKVMETLGVEEYKYKDRHYLLVNYLSD